MSLEVKSAELKQLYESGEGEALFSLWGTEDSDLDITERGFFGNGVQEVFMIPHHLMSSGNPPLGKGLIHETSMGAVYKFRMNLHTSQGKDWHQHLLFDLSTGEKPRQVWSYGYRILSGGFTPRQDRRGRLLHAIKATGQPGALVLEVSPVVAASQPLSRTLTAKADGAPLTAGQREDAMRIEAWLQETMAGRQQAEQSEARRLHLRYLRRALDLQRS